MNCHSVSLTRKKLDWTPYIRLLMTKPTSVTIVTCSRTIVNNAPPPKRTQQQTSNSLGIPLRRTNVKGKKKAHVKNKIPKEVIREGYYWNLKILLDVPAILLVPKATPHKESKLFWITCRTTSLLFWKLDKLHIQ